MATRFGDAAFYIAIINERDTLHATALLVAGATQDDQQITTEAVIIEVCDYFCMAGPHMRAAAARFVEVLRADARLTIIPQTTELLDDGLRLYRARPDKGYSLTDCMSMVICAREGITEVLTHDRHFEQEGLTPLL